MLHSLRDGRERSIETVFGSGVHTALINLHPVFGSVEDGFEVCRMYR